jgi:DNA-directed RNA polymerase specialized sigma24 family protein
VTAWRDLSALRDPDRFDAWLRRLLVRECYRQAELERRRRRIEVHVPAFDRGTPDATAELADHDELDASLRSVAGPRPAGGTGTCPVEVRGQGSRTSPRAGQSLEARAAHEVGP